MTVTRESLMEHFGLLSDEELLEQFQSGDLTELAHGVASGELRRRNIDPAMRLAQPTTPAAEPEADIGSESEPELDNEDLVQVGRFFNPVDANLLQSRLDAEGVPAIVADALAYQNLPFGSVIGGVRVLVPESYLARAVEIKKEIDRGDFALDDKADVG